MKTIEDLMKEPKEHESDDEMTAWSACLTKKTTIFDFWLARHDDGQCPKCGIQTHHINNNVRIPINNHHTMEGRCLLCHPISTKYNTLPPVSERPIKKQKEVKTGKENLVELVVKDNDLALKDDPDYKKYWKMMNVGVPKDAVRQAVLRDGRNPAIVDLDLEQSLKTQMKQAKIGISHKDDPNYTKYLKMMKIGIPKGAVRNEIIRDGRDPTFINFYPEKSLKTRRKNSYASYSKPSPTSLIPQKSAVAASVKLNHVLLIKKLNKLGITNKHLLKSFRKDEEHTWKDDPDFKYWKMLEMGLSKDAVRNALIRHGKDPDILYLDPNRPIKIKDIVVSTSGKALTFDQLNAGTFAKSAVEVKVQDQWTAKKNTTKEVWLDVPLN